MLDVDFLAFRCFVFLLAASFACFASLLLFTVQQDVSMYLLQGRQAMEWVIEKIKEETSELSRAARMRIDRAAVQVDHGLDLVEENVAKTLPGSASSRP